MLQPEKLREIVYLLLFGMTQHKENNEKDLMDMVMQELKVSRSAARQGLDVCQKIVAALENIDGMISEMLLTFSFDRIQNAELAILRLSFWEMFIQKTEPPKVILSEAKRLAKKFAEEEATRFVLGLLINACSKQGIILETALSEDSIDVSRTIISESEKEQGTP
jgi:N utilization substance protein B